MKGTGGEYFGGLVNQRVWRLVDITLRRVQEFTLLRMTGPD